MITRRGFHLPRAVAGAGEWERCACCGPAAVPALIVQNNFSRAICFIASARRTAREVLT